jgi:hypothetical protein
MMMMMMMDMKVILAGEWILILPGTLDREEVTL